LSATSNKPPFRPRQAMQGGAGRTKMAAPRGAAKV
jgi:hypothetical protein